MYWSALRSFNWYGPVPITSLIGFSMWPAGMIDRRRIVEGQERRQRREGLLQGQAYGVVVDGLDRLDIAGDELAARGEIGPPLQGGDHVLRRSSVGRCGM